MGCRRQKGKKVRGPVRRLQLSAVALGRNGGFPRPLGGWINTTSCWIWCEKWEKEEASMTQISHLRDWSMVVSLTKMGESEERTCSWEWVAIKLCNYISAVCETGKWGCQWEARIRTWNLEVGSDLEAGIWGLSTCRWHLKPHELVRSQETVWWGNRRAEGLWPSLSLPSSFLHSPSPSPSFFRL